MEMDNGDGCRPDKQEDKLPSLVSMSRSHDKFQSNGAYGQFPVAANTYPSAASGVPAVVSYSSLVPPQKPVGAGHVRSRSLSHPPHLSLDALSAFNPKSAAYRADPSSSGTSIPTDSISADVSMDDPDATTSRDGLPPRKAHRRSQSEIPFASFQSSLAPIAEAPPLPQQQQRSGLSYLNSLEPLSHGGYAGSDLQRAPNGVVAEGVTEDDLFDDYMNLDGFDDALNPYEANNGYKTCVVDASQIEADNKANGSGSNGVWVHRNLSLEKKEGSGKQVAGAELAGMPSPAARHCRSLSMDSIMGRLNFADGSRQLLPTAGQLSGQSSIGNYYSYGGSSSCNSEFSKGEFTPLEMKKIMANDKLVEMALTDPKRVKRILANRQSAARSKERKMRYIQELEQKVQALQTETTTLFAQINLLQRDSVALTNKNNELKFRLQAMEQQGHLRDALNEALTAEVQRLKLATSGFGDPYPTSNLNQETDIQMFQMQQKQQSPDISLYQLQKQQNEDAKDN